MYHSFFHNITDDDADMDTYAEANAGSNADVKGGLMLRLRIMVAVVMVKGLLAMDH